MAPGLAGADPGTKGRWSPVQEYPVVPISAAVTGDGRIVAWDQADAGRPHTLAPNNGRAIIIDPERGVVGRSANLAPASAFCPLITTLPDGRVAIAGGGNNATDSRVVQTYDPSSGTFGAWSSMTSGRWYAGGGIASDGDIVAIGGRGGTAADVIDATTGVARRLNVYFPTDEYPLALRTPDGRFVIENVTDPQDSRPATRQILGLSGSGSLTSASNLSLLQIRRRMTATMVGPYTLLAIGGGTSRASYTLDVSSGDPVAHDAGVMAAPHMTGTAVTLPDGSAVVIGGNSTGSPAVGTPVFGVERWSPTTGQWSAMADTPRQRQYHSVSALLPDGRVWSAGTSANDSVTNTAVHEYNGAYFSPPYLFKKDGSGQLAPRPEITQAPASAAWGERITVTSPQAASIRSASLVRLSATTHQFDFSGTFVPLSVTVEGDRVAMNIPANGNQVPAGRYMLFVVDSAGVPSRAAIISVTPTAGGLADATATVSSMAAGAHDAWNGFDGDTSTASSIATKKEREPWWQVDLGRSRHLESLTIANPTSASGARLASAWVYTSDRPFTSVSVEDTRAQGGVTATQLPATVGGSVTVSVRRTARFVRVQLPGDDALGFAELIPNYGSAPSLALERVSESGAESEVRVINRGPAAATITKAVPPGDDWSQSSGPTLPVVVPAGGEVTLRLRRGTANGDLVLSAAAGPDLRLALTGLSPRLRVQRVSTSDTETVVRVTNSGTAAASIARVATPGAGWSQVRGPATPFDVPPDGEVELTLRRGTTDGDLVVTPVSGPPLTLALTGFTPPRPSAVADPSAGGWILNGAAAVADGGLRLTEATPDQRGSAYWPEELDSTRDLTVQFDATIADGTGADGVAMILADPARGATATELGGLGGSLGFGGTPGWAVALLPATNGTGEEWNFVGLSDGLRVDEFQALNWLGTAKLPARLQNTTARVRVVFSGGRATISVNDLTTLTLPLALPDRVLLGFSAATGGLTNRHAIRNVNVQGTIAPSRSRNPEPTPTPQSGGQTVGGGSTSGGPGTGTTKRPPATTYRGPRRTVTKTVSGARLGLIVPKACVRPGQRFALTLRASRQAGTNNRFVNVRRVDFSQGARLRFRDRAAPFTYNDRISPTRKPGASVTVRARAYIKLKRGNGPTTSIGARIRVCT